MRWRERWRFHEVEEPEPDRGPASTGGQAVGFEPLGANFESWALAASDLTAAAGRAKVLSRSFFNPREFSKPVDRTEWLQRVRSNAGHYKLIYSVVFVSALVYTILSSPLLLLGMAATAGAWAYAFVLTSPDTALQVFGFELRRREKLIALVPFSILVVTLTGMINSLIYVLCISSCISLPHASFHEVSELDALDALELQGLAAPDPLSVGKDFEVPS